jgi:hypothetical protein
MKGEEGAEGPNTVGLGHCELCFNGATPEQVAACEMPVPHGLEARLLEEMGAEGETGVSGETVVAWAVVGGS